MKAPKRPEGDTRRGTVSREAPGRPYKIGVRVKGRARRYQIVEGSESWSWEHAWDHAEEETARAEKRAKQDQALAAVVAKGTAGETLAQFAERWLEARARLGNTTVRDDRGRLDKWILRSLGATPVAGITREHVERLVADLNEKVRARELAWKTAGNVWAVFQRLMKDAAGVKSEVPELRVRKDNPVADVLGPKRGGKKTKPYLYPSEALAFMSSAAVPIAWRRMLAVGAYTYMRTGELEALEWGDVDLDHATMSVHHATSRDGDDGSTKTETVRTIPIEPALMPLLQLMRDESDGEGRVLDMPSRRALARGLRLYLGKAGVTRKALFTSDATRKPINFYYATRRTGITWAAVRADDPIKIQRRAGHAAFAMTEEYIAEAENLRPGFGEPFPELPEGLAGSPKPAAIGSRLDPSGLKQAKPKRGGRDSNPRPPA